MEHVLGLDCLVCGERYDPGAIDYVCPRHGEDGIVDVAYDYPAIGSPVDPDAPASVGMWRYRPLLPVAAGAPVPPIQVGGIAVSKCRCSRGQSWSTAWFISLKANSGLDLCLWVARRQKLVKSAANSQ